MTDEVVKQYEAFPYPERDPADEARRLITGSPSLPQEMDHHLWGGARDWSRPLRALVAGGGTGDGLIQLCQVLAWAGRPYEVTYVDLSRAARAVAEERARLRNLGNIRFETGSLLDAPDFGSFDYIDCCGVLHHLPDPQAGFDALARALAPGGGMGLMVYAPLGRAGVYPLQAAFGRLTRDMTPDARLAAAKAIFRNLPEGHPFRRNPHLVDHKESDAGFYDLLLHSSDRPFTITELLSALDTAGLELAGVPEPASYDPAELLPDPSLMDGLSAPELMQIAEDLRGTFKTHVVYAKRKGEAIKPPLGKPDAIPCLRGINPGKLANAIAAKGSLSLASGGQKRKVAVPRAAAPLVARVDGRADLAALRQGANLDQFAFNAAWGAVERALTVHGLLHYSGVLRSGGQSTRA